MYVNPSLQGDNNWVVMLLRHLVVIVEWWSSPLSLSLSLFLSLSHPSSSGSRMQQSLLQETRMHEKAKEKAPCCQSLCMQAGGGWMIIMITAMPLMSKAAWRLETASFPRSKLTRARCANPFRILPLPFGEALVGAFSTLFARAFFCKRREATDMYLLRLRTYHSSRAACSPWFQHSWSSSCAG